MARAEDIKNEQRVQELKRENIRLEKGYEKTREKREAQQKANLEEIEALEKKINAANEARVKSINEQTKARARKA